MTKIRQLVQKMYKDKVKDIQFTTDDLLAGDSETQDVVKEPQTFNISLK